MSKRFAGKVVLVTAGGSGIGEATCEAFAREGASLMIADVNQPQGEAVAERLRGGGADKVRFCRTDVTSDEEVERLVRATVESFGGLHIAVNVVGVMHREAAGPLLHLNSTVGWDFTVAATLSSMFLSCKYEIAHMIDHGGGSIVNVASVGGVRYVPESGAAYGASKAGVIHLTKFAALSYAEHGIRVNCLAPGVTETPVLRTAAEVLNPDLSPDGALAKFTQEVVTEHAIKRMVQPSEQANAVLWLSSEEAAMVTGLVLAVDGGYMAR